MIRGFFCFLGKEMVLKTRSPRLENPLVHEATAQPTPRSETETAAKWRFNAQTRLVRILLTAVVKSFRDDSGKTAIAQRKKQR